MPLPLVLVLVELSHTDNVNVLQSCYVKALSEQSNKEVMLLKMDIILLDTRREE